MEQFRKELVTFMKNQCQKYQLQIGKLSDELALNQKFYKNFYDDSIVEGLKQNIEKLLSEA